jgi:hypothetical protein
VAQPSGPAKPQGSAAGQHGSAVMEHGSAAGQQAPGTAQRPTRLLAAAAVTQAIEAAGVLLASVLVMTDTIEGKAYSVGSGIALTFIGIATAVALGYVAAGLARVRPWSRTPALLTQFFVAVFSIYLVRDLPEWGGPGLVLAATGLAAVLAPSSIRTLAGLRPGEPKSRAS